MNNYWLIGGGAVLGLLLVASVVVAVLRDEAEFAPGSPEAVIQTYLRALDRNDLRAVHGALSPELRERCSIEDMFDENDLHRWRLRDGEVTLEGSQTIERTTFVTVRIARLSDGGLFGPSEYSFEETFALRQFDEDWKLSREPWPHFACTRDAPE